MENLTASQIIDALGGTNAVAEEFNVTAGAVSQWRTNGIPRHVKTILMTRKYQNKLAKNPC